MDLESRDREGVAEKREVKTTVRYYNPYPIGFNAHTCPRSNETPNQFGQGLELVHKGKRSIDARAANHTEYADPPSLLLGRDNLCTVVGYIDPVLFKGDAANTQEAFFRYRYSYVFSFVFDAVVTRITTWERVKPGEFREVATDLPKSPHGRLLMRGTGAFIHYYFEFEPKEGTELDDIGGRISLFQLYG
ncbi:hypothetical protein MMC07_002845 [Pseudocyphellaria aurata]|nr:hypothetical protein [Pseudocyphellaria aurata]